ncbi:Nuclease-related domain-containing protein [Fibrobacter sp. UWH5]|uniref:DNA/RNA helicase domain-containing protein n=1 Tax=Fibrobacter sp. UWH5 TaxID=1896211 RepID=UPI00091BCEB1|nr:DNA/RNA helicase domain-containing protein [Fibrobacter sp. UWH5]SHL44492.1 Nuclease-related domain-containing protein [Fibrobacter sp. UWH5]
MSTIRKRLSTESTSRSEMAIFDMASCLDEKWNVWMNVHLNFAVRGRGNDVDREVDCILYHKKYGMLLIECKDGQISTEESQGSENGFMWKQGNRVMERSPVQQVQSLIYPLHDHFSGMFPKDEGAGYHRVRVQWAVCFADMDSVGKIGSNAMQPKRAILKSDLKSYNTLERKVKKILEMKEESRGGNPFPNDELSDENFDRLVSFLGCFDEPSWPELWDMQAEARVRPTEIQEMLMESIVRNPRMRIEGVAGSGKSLLVQWEATRLAREGKRVVVLCYNDLLAEHMQQNFVEAGLDESQVVMSGFHKLAAKYVRLAKVKGVARKEPDDAKEKAEYFESMSVFFKEALEKLRGKKNRFFDALIIDEGQDFANDWLDTALLLLKDPEKGIVRFFYDSKQTLYKGREVLGNAAINAMPVMVLKRGFRSTKKILNWVHDVTDIRIPCYEDTVPGREVDVRLYDKPEDQVEMLRKVVLDLKKKGVEPKDILVVSLRSKNHSGLASLNDDVFQWSDVSDSLNSLAINMVSAYRYKGLDKRVVILTDLEPSKNDPGAPHSNANLILVGATRAKEHLVVFKQRKNF